MTYSLHPEAEADLREAATFYEEQAGGSLAQAFLAEFEHSLARLLDHPEIGPTWRHGRRRLVMGRFPYSVIYSVSSEEVAVLAVAHHSRRPGYWRGRK